ncbi:MAG: DUF3467 domain-containing protein [Deinococcus sp.]|nr:DUF3467 domain-containing protein [Deinococcus sp.]
MTDKPTNPTNIQVELDPQAAEGIYSNAALISHTPNEFILDFARLFPGQEKARIRSRIITSPAHAKAFLASLRDNIARYEAKYGEIKLHTVSEAQKN